MADRPSRYNLDSGTPSTQRISGGPGRDGDGSGAVGSQPPQPQQPMPANPMTPLFMMLFMLMIITSPGLRAGMGAMAGSALEPTIGNDGELPVLTLLLAGLVMVCSTTLIRHFIMDWSKMAEVQQKMGAFQKEIRKARQSGNFAKTQKLMEKHQPQVMTMQTEMSSSQMKPMIFTMIIALPIFMWLFTFIDGLAWQYASLPWEPFWYFQDRIIILPHWIILYSLMSLPFGQALQRGLKLMTFIPELKELKESKAQKKLLGLKKADRQE